MGQSGQGAASCGERKNRVRRGIVVFYKRTTVEEGEEEEEVEEEIEYRRTAQLPRSPSALPESPPELPFEIVIITHTRH